MSLDVTILGSGSALPMLGRMPSAHAVQSGRATFLVDCGEGTQMRLLASRISFETIRAIFLTHAHGDHTLGIFGLLASMGMQHRKRGLTVYGPRGFTDIFWSNVHFFSERVEFDLSYEPLDDDEPLVVYQDSRLTVESIPLRHRIPTVGFVFREVEHPLNVSRNAVSRYGLTLEEIALAKRGYDIHREGGEVIPAASITFRRHNPVSYAYLSDTRFSERAIALLGHVDTLYHEATYMENLSDNAKETGHSTTRQAAEFARRVGADRLIVGHFSSRYEDVTPIIREVQHYFPNATAAKEGDRYRMSSFNCQGAPYEEVMKG